MDEELFCYQSLGEKYRKESISIIISAGKLLKVT